MQTRSVLRRQSLSSEVQSLLHNMDYFQGFLHLAIFVLFAYNFSGSRCRNLPPGPLQFPVIGNILQVYLADSTYPHRAFVKLARKYGNILWLRIGSTEAVVLNGFSTIKAALTETEDFLDRFDDDWILDRSFGKHIGLLESRTELWKPTRRFTARHLRDFGFGKKQSMQGFVNEELGVILGHFDRVVKDYDGVLSPDTLFQFPALNLAFASAAGFRFDQHDPQILELLRLSSEFLETARISGGILFAFPWLTKILPWFFNHSRVCTISHAIQAFAKEIVYTEKSKGTYKADPKSFLHAFLLQMESAQVSSEDALVFNEENLITILGDLFLAAGHTTSATMAFACFWLTIHQDVQEKCYQEIVRVIGKDCRPQLEDKMALPYVRAAILEIHRKSTIVPILPHKVYKDIQFQGFHIPKDTRVIINTYSSQMDPKMWGDPENFRPERFLDDENNIVNEHKLLTFSIGKRNCIGEAVAEASVFAFLTGILQKYRLLPLTKGYKYDESPVFGAAMSPRPFEIRVQSRSQQEE